MKKVYQLHANPREDSVMLQLLARVVLNANQRLSPPLPTDWKNYLLDIKYFTEDLICRLKQTLLFFIVQFFNREEVIEKLKTDQINYERKVLIAAMIDWHPENMNTFDNPTNYLFHMYHCSVKNIEYEFKEEVVYSIPNIPLLYKILGVVLGYGIVNNNKAVLNSLKHIIENFLNTENFAYFFFMVIDVMKNNEKSISKEGLEWFEKSGIIENLMEVNFHFQLNGSKRILFNPELDGLYHFFPEKMKSLIMKNTSSLLGNNYLFSSVIIFIISFAVVTEFHPAEENPKVSFVDFVSSNNIYIT